jgi:hypothetical protein
VPGANPEDIVVGWTDEPGSIFVGSESAVPLRVERLDLETGRRVPVRTLGPADLAGVLGIAPVIMTRNGRWYAYATHTTVSHLFVVDGAR